MAERGITEVREQEAREFIDEPIRLGWLDKNVFGDNRNFKPWYSHRSLFQEGITRVYIGIAPGGDPRFPDNTTGRRYQIRLAGDRYNAYLDEKWRGSAVGNSPLQRQTRRVFRELYGEWDGDVELRRTACFNVCPVRTGESSIIRNDLWRKSVEWCRQVVDDLKPTTIICNGSGWRGRSPWAALEATEEWSAPVSGSAYLKYGFVKLDDSQPAQVIGLPHLTGARYRRADLFRVLSEHSDWLVAHEKE